MWEHCTTKGEIKMRYSCERLKKRGVLSVISFLCVFLFFNVSAFAFGNPLKTNDLMPDILLPVPQSDLHRNYLGLSGSEKFFLEEIKTRFLIIEIYTMYWPICQREAPSVKKLYETIQAHNLAKDDIKLIGIGVQNDSYEIEFYRDRYKIPFPLFEDKELDIHEKIGGPATPFFIVVALNGQGKNTVIHTLLGGFESPEIFLDTILEKTGLK